MKLLEWKTLTSDVTQNFLELEQDEWFQLSPSIHHFLQSSIFVGEWDFMISLKALEISAR